MKSLGEETQRCRKAGTNHLKKKRIQLGLQVVCFLSTTAIQCLVADCPQVLGSSLWFKSGSKQNCGM